MPDEYSFTRSLQNERGFTKSLWEEKDRPPFTDLLMQSIKDVKFPVLGMYDIKLDSLDWGKNATWVARMLPGQETLEDWGDQTTAQKIRTGAQFVSVAGLAGMYMDKGMGMIEAMGAARAQNKQLKKGIDKLVSQVKEMGPRYTEVPPKKGQVPRGWPYKEYTTEPKVGQPYTGARRVVPAQRIRGEEAFLKVTKKVSAPPPSLSVLAKQFETGGMNAVVRQVKAPFTVTEIVKKEALHTSLERMGLTMFKANVPTASAGPGHARDIATFITAGLPKTFSPKVADVMVDQALKLISAAVPQLDVFDKATLPKRITDIPTKLPSIRERFVGAVPVPEKEAVAPVMKPAVKPPLDLTLAVRNIKTGKIIKAREGELIHTDMMPRLKLKPADMELGWVDAKDKFYDVFSVHRGLAGPVSIEEVPKFGAITEHQLATINSLRVDKKFSPRLMRKATMAFADKPGIGQLNEKEAAALIEGMKAVPLRPTGKPYLPPHRGDLLPSHFFTKGRAAGVESWVVPAWREFERINAKEIYDPVETAYVNYQHEVHDKYRLFDELRKSVKGVKGSEKRLFHYLNGTLSADVTLSPQETTVATQLRTVLDNYADRLGLPPERRLENYIYHMFEAATQQELSEKYPFTDEQHTDVPLTDATISALGFKVPKNIFTPTLLKRLGRQQGLVEDVWKAMRAVTSIDLRRIHMQPALEQVRPMIKGYPETSRSYINDWLSYAVLKQEPPLDKIINRSTDFITTFMEKATKGKVSFGANPAKTMGYMFSRLAYGGAVAFNLAITGKNLTQQMLIPPLLNNPVHYGQAMGDLFTTKGHYLLKQSKVLTERFPMEAFDPKDVSKWLQKGMEPYKLVDWLNVSMAFLAGVRDAQALGLSPEEVVKYGDRIAKVSQYSYRPIDMPRFMWQGGGVGRAAGTLQSWPINYFTNYLPELTYTAFTGYDTAGNKVPLHARGRLLEHLVIASLFIYGMYKYAKVDFRKTFGPGVMPTYLAPTLNLTMAIGQTAHGWVTNDYREREEGIRKLSNITPIFLPAGLQVKKTYDAYRKLTEGVETDRAGRWRRNVSAEEAIKGVFTYPAERSEFWDTQNKVWNLDNRMRDIQQNLSALEHRGASYGKIHRLEDKLVGVGEQRAKFAEKLAAIKEGYPTEDDREWIEALLHTWGLWP